MFKALQLEIACSFCRLAPVLLVGGQWPSLRCWPPGTSHKGNPKMNSLPFMACLGCYDPHRAAQKEGPFAEVSHERLKAIDGGWLGRYLEVGIDGGQQECGRVTYTYQTSCLSTLGWQCWRTTTVLGAPLLLFCSHSGKPSVLWFPASPNTGVLLARLGITVVTMVPAYNDEPSPPLPPQWQLLGFKIYVHVAWWSGKKANKYIAACKLALRYLVDGVSSDKSFDIYFHLHALAHDLETFKGDWSTPLSSSVVERRRISREET